jgi:hypothetical protein
MQKPDELARARIPRALSHLSNVEAYLQSCVKFPEKNLADSKMAVDN